MSVTYAGRVLSVYGTGGNDVISVALRNGRVAVFENGVQTASFATVRSILVEGGGGRDKIGIDSKITVGTKLVGGSGNDSIAGGGGPDVLYGGSGNDLLLGQAGVDALLGGSENDTLDGGTGDDYLDGQAGNDQLDGRAGDDVLEGGIGLDTVTYADRTAPITARITEYIGFEPSGRGGAAGETDEYRSIEVLIGGKGNDSLTGAYFDYEQSPFDTDKFPAIADYDVGLSGGSLIGGDGDDEFGFAGNADHWASYGQSGNDRFIIGSDDDATYGYISGGDGSDWQIIERQAVFQSEYGNGLAADVENAELRGVQYVFHGNDLDNRIIDFGGVYAIYGEGGNDHVTVNGLSVDEPVTVFGGDGNDRLEGGHYGRVSLVGEGGNDVLTGGRYNDTLSGGTGNDALFGKAGDDSLDGGEGNDYIEGNEGIDTLLGNLGDDAFYTRDRIADFVYGGEGTDTLKGDATEGVVDSVEVIL